MIGRPQGVPPDAQSTPPQISRFARITAIVLRSLSIAVLLALTWRVSSPQSETIWTAYETPGDLVRLILGLAVCLWLVVHLFILPKDASSYRTWLYLGFIVVPLGLILTVAIW
jgi:TRAP-type C4-dicarboxylate transport system permease small subunit